MFKGIQLLLLLFMSHSAFAGEEVVDKLIGRCKSLGGDYDVEAVDDPDGKRRECHAVKCSLSENADDATVAQVEAAFPEGSGAFIGGWKTQCYERRDSDQVLKDATGGEFEVKGFGWVDLDMFNKLCGEDRSKCKLDGGVWVRLPGFDSDGSSDGSSGRRDGTGTYIHREGGISFRCSYGESLEACIGNDANIIRASYSDGMNCVDCSSGSYRGGVYGTLSGIAEVAGAILPPVMGYMGVKAQSKAFLRSNQAWAGAATAGFENCRMMQTNYIDGYYADVQAQRNYVVNQGLPDQEFGGNMNIPGCNGYQLSAFGGAGGFMGNGMGGYGNPWFSAGYTPGFMGGMYGPYGMQNPYGNPFSRPGFGLQIGLGGGYPGGFGGGFPGGGGFGGGGFGGGFPGGYAGGGMMCITQPCPGQVSFPGMGGGFQLGIGGGFGGGFPGGGFGGTMPGGMGGFPGAAGGFGGGMYGNPYFGGHAGAGVAPWGNGAGSYWNGSGGWGGGSAGWGNVQQSYAGSNQAFMQDQYLQQAALGNSYQQSARNLWSNGYGGQAGMSTYGYAPYSPGNVGFSLNAGWGFGW
tara:strand:+ start:144129 stop:145853 length:1725 start_codon:yes stop_codon:yes gene_type:complete